MNAYEIADELQKHGLNGDNHGLFNKRIQNMLRQQADQIAELEGEVSHLKHINKNWSISEGWALQRIAELEKEVTRLIGAEPITYGTFTVCKNCGQQDPYTQTKPLSDEEIYQLWCEADNTELLPEMRMKDGSINYIITTFARAIEERHGIK